MIVDLKLRDDEAAVAGCCSVLVAAAVAELFSTTKEQPRL